MIENKEILDRLSDSTIDVLEAINPNFTELKSIQAGVALSAISNSHKGLGDIFKNLEISTKSTKRINISDWLVDAYYEAYIADSKVVELNHLVLALLLRVSTEKYYQAKKVFPKLTADSNMRAELTSYIQDYTELATKKNHIFIGREKELTHLIVNLSTDDNKPILLFGDSGSGKTSLMFELAHRINQGLVPSTLLGARVLRIKFANIAGLLPIDGVGNVHSAVLSRFLNQAIGFNEEKNQKIILFFDELNFTPNLFVGIESSSGFNKRVLFVGAINDVQSDRFWESPVAKMWRLLPLEEMHEEDIRRILHEKSKHIKKSYSVKFEKPAIAKIIELYKQNAFGSAFPGSGIKAMDLLSTYKRHVSTDYDLIKSITEDVGVANDSEHLQAVYDDLARADNPVVTVSEEDVEEFFAFHGSKKDNEDNISGIPKDKLRSLEDELKRVVVSQDDAISALARALRVSKLKLQSQSRPIGSFLFLGPTGVGKTYTAKMLARVLFGFREGSNVHPDKFLRIDMTEFSEKHNVSRLFGAPPGYIGYDDGASLSDFVRANPSCVVLFDEIDKAHPEVLNSLLHIMDEGEIRNNSGDIISFEQAIILMTSNHGAELISKGELGFNDGGADITVWREGIKKGIKKHLKPEFLNRFDEIIVFDKLSDESLLVISDLILNPIINNLADTGVILKVTKPVKRFLVRKCGSEYGARELKRVIDKELMDRVSVLLLADESITKIKTYLHDGGIKLISNE